VSRARTQKPRDKRAATDRPRRVATRADEAGTFDGARSERHVMLESGSQAIVRASRASTNGIDLPARQASEISLDGDPLDDLVELRELRRLAVAIHETAPNLVAARHAIGAAGHEVVKAASGRAGEAELQQFLLDGELDVLFVGLPAGEALIDAALALGVHRPVIVASAPGPAVEVIHQATAAGADLAVSRPFDAEKLAPVLFAAARLSDERRQVANAKGSEQVLRARLDELAAPEPGTLQPFELFQRVLELELKRAKRSL
jgi:AmiR/NasT family two-component response regulator